MQEAFERSMKHLENYGRKPRHKRSLMNPFSKFSKISERLSHIRADVNHLRQDVTQFIAEEISTLKNIPREVFQHIVHVATDILEKTGFIHKHNSPRPNENSEVVSSKRSYNLVYETELMSKKTVSTVRPEYYTATNDLDSTHSVFRDMTKIVQTTNPSKKKKRTSTAKTPRERVTTNENGSLTTKTAANNTPVENDSIHNEITETYTQRVFPSETTTDEKLKDPTRSPPIRQTNISPISEKKHPLTTADERTEYYKNPHHGSHHKLTIETIYKHERNGQPNGMDHTNAGATAQSSNRHHLVSK